MFSLLETSTKVLTNGSQCPLNIAYMGDTNRRGPRIAVVVYVSGFGFVIQVYASIVMDYQSF